MAQQLKSNQARSQHQSLLQSQSQAQQQQPCLVSLEVNYCLDNITDLSCMYCNQCVVYQKGHSKTALSFLKSIPNKMFRMSRQTVRLRKLVSPWHASNLYFILQTHDLSDTCALQRDSHSICGSFARFMCHGSCILLGSMSWMSIHACSLLHSYTVVVGLSRNTFPHLPVLCDDVHDPNNGCKED